MAHILFVFGTSTGHTARVAQEVAGELRHLGHTLDLVDVGEDKPISFDAVDAVILAGSVRMGRFQRKLVAFAHDNRDAIARLPNAFLAVSLAAARASDPSRREVAKTLARFEMMTHWTPDKTMPVAGALFYTRYGFFTKLVMRLISRMVGGDTEPSRDYDYTDWNALAEFASRFDAELRSWRRAPPPSSKTMCGAPEGAREQE